MVMEAVAAKVAKQDEDEAKKHHDKDWKKDKEGLARLREIAGG